MSGSTIGGVVGGIVGAFFGNPQLGFVIGSMIGGAIDPDVIKGPRISDGTAQTSQVGIPITYGWGTFPTAGNVIFTSKLREVRRKDKGKGGPVTVTYHPYRSFAIGICRARLGDDDLFDPITGILKVKRNGKVVYNVLPDATAEERAGNTKFLQKHQFFLGGETQMPSSVIESFEGAGNVSAYRHLVYMVADDVDLTDTSGAIPQYEFVVVMQGTESDIAYPGSITAPEDGVFVDNHWPLGSSGGFVYSTTTGGPFASTVLQDVIDHVESAIGQSISKYIGYYAWPGPPYLASDLHGPQWVDKTPESALSLKLIYAGWPVKGAFSGHDCSLTPPDTTGRDYYLDDEWGLNRKIPTPVDLNIHPDETAFNNCIYDTPATHIVGYQAQIIEVTKSKLYGAELGFSDFDDLRLISDDMRRRGIINTVIECSFVRVNV